ncbi:MAG: GNAT family N-acetyltransferase [Provencibacterium sp.]|nr:GNAT family N-acetyltransferase [Provencibacterium sp.]
MIDYRQMDESCLPWYDKISMRVNISRIYHLEKTDRGLGGIRLIETPVAPYVKDFCPGEEERAQQWSKRFDIRNWAFFMAFDGQRPVGAAAVAFRTPGVHMLAGREDLAVLWDIRVEEAYKGQGIGQGLFDRAAGWAKRQGCRQLKIECQNNNLPAIRFYHKQGAVLCALDEYAYCDEPACRQEVQLIWYLDL